MGLRAAEMLVIELAAGRAGIGFVQTESQKELNIPAFLVYLLGVVIAEDQFLKITKGTPDAVAAARQRRFKEFQQQYLDAGGEKALMDSPVSFCYIMTTRILPNKAQQDIIVNDLMLQVKHLELAALKAAQSLMEDEKALQEKELAKLVRREKKKAKQRAKKRNEAASKENGEDDESTGATEVEGQEEESQEEKPKEESSSAEITNKDDGGTEMESPLESSAPNRGNAMPWNPTENQIFIKDETCNASKDGGLQLSKDIGCDKMNESIDESNMEEASLTQADEVSGAEKIGSLVDDLNIPRSIPTSPSKEDASMDRNNIDHPPNSELIQKIADLENELEEANRRSEEERLAHTKALRSEKERYENLLQSLQLRLYISENKVRTYEEALEQHIAAISTINRSSTFVKPNAEERIPASPSLISKVLESTRVARNEEA